MISPNESPSEQIGVHNFSFAPARDFIWLMRFSSRLHGIPIAMMQIAWFYIMAWGLSAGIPWTNDYTYNLSHCSGACIYITHSWVFFVRLGTVAYYGLEKGIALIRTFSRLLANVASTMNSL